MNKTDLQENAPPVCVSIAGLDPSGGAGLIADVRTISAFGCFPAGVLTAVTFQDTRGVYGSVPQDAGIVYKQLDPLFEDYEIAAVKTGMLPTEGVIGAVSDLLRANRTQNVVVDPVVRSTTGFPLIDETALDALVKELFPIAALVTPNIPEAELMAGIKINSEDDIVMAAGVIRGAGAENVLIKGGHLPFAAKRKGKISESGPGERVAKDFLFFGDEMIVFESAFIEAKATHGTGCVLAAAIAANLALGKALPDAVRVAKDFVSDAIRNAPRIGKGNSPAGMRSFETG